MDEEVFQEFLEEEFPAVTKALVERMETLYPDRCPEMTDPDRLVWLKTGQRSVVAFLRSRYNQQQDIGED